MTKKLSDADAVLPVCPDEPDDAGEEQHEDDFLEAEEVGLDVHPVVAKFHSDEGQAETPGPRTEKRVDMKAQARHAGDARRQSDERTHDGQQTRDENGGVAIFAEETVGEVHVVVAEHDVAAIFLNQPTSSEVSDLIGQHRTKIASDGARSGGQI